MISMIVQSIFSESEQNPIVHQIPQNSITSSPSSTQIGVQSSKYTNEHASKLNASITVITAPLISLNFTQLC